MASIQTLVPPSTGFRPGRLVIVGSGIKGISQLTLEAVGHIEEADKVFYCVADPATELFIQNRNKNSTDLYVLYDDDKPRFQTYIQMAELMLREVRKGFYVVGVFYGHPGVFVNPAHRAISIAASEGFEATMLPGVSAEDCLFADIGVDPSSPGCQTLEATDLVLRDRQLATDCHLVIFQVGSVGELAFNFQGFKNTKFQVLVQRLQKHYGPDHPVVLYVASQYPILPPTIERYKIKDFEDPEVANRVTGISTFYLPPKLVRQVSTEGATDLGLKILVDNAAGRLSSTSRPSFYGSREISAVKALDTHTTPKNYKQTRGSPAFFEALRGLAVSPKELERFKSAPSKYAASFEGLNPIETYALARAHPGLLRGAMKRSAEDIALDFVHHVTRNPTLAHGYVSTLLTHKRKQEGRNSIMVWLKEQGYDISADAIYQASQEAILHKLSLFDSLYNTRLNGQGGPTILIQQGLVIVDGKRIKKHTYASGALIWHEKDSNETSAILHLSISVSEDGKALPPGSYVGPQFFGFLWKSNEAKPRNSNIVGKVGMVPDIDESGQIIISAISSLAGTFETYIMDPGEKYKHVGTLSIESSESASKIRLNGQEVKNFKYSDDTLFWSTGHENSTNASLYFHHNAHSTKANPILGLQFSGRLWPIGEKPPTKPNIFGLFGKPEDPSSVSGDAQAMMVWKSSGINLGNGIAAINLGQSVIEYNKIFTSWIDSPDQANTEALKKAELDVASRQADVVAVSQGTSQSFPGTIQPFTPITTFPPSLLERWPILNSLFPLTTLPYPGRDIFGTPPIMITFLYPLQVTVNPGPPNQVTPLDLTLFGVANVQNDVEVLHLNVFEFGTNVVVNEVVELLENVDVDAIDAADAADAADVDVDVAVG